MSVFSENVKAEELKEMYKEKAREIMKPPGFREIEKDPRLPSYDTFKEHLGIPRECEDLKEIIEKYQKLHIENKKLCSDCSRDEKKCKKDVRECRKEAKLYFTLYDTIF